MSAAAFARRLGMSHAGVRKLEAAEASDAITLASLRKLAAALDCELHYALVPRTNLEQQLHDRAESVAKERLRQMNKAKQDLVTTQFLFQREVNLLLPK